MVSKISEIDEDVDDLYEKLSRTKHVELTKGKNETEKEKTNNEGDGKSSKSSNTAKPKPSKKNK